MSCGVFASGMEVNTSKTADLNQVTEREGSGRCLTHPDVLKRR